MAKAVLLERVAFDQWHSTLQRCIMAVGLADVAEHLVAQLPGDALLLTSQACVSLRRFVQSDECDAAWRSCCLEVCDSENACGWPAKRDTGSERRERERGRGREREGGREREAYPRSHCSVVSVCGPDFSLSRTDS